MSYWHRRYIICKFDIYHINHISSTEIQRPVKSNQKSIVLFPFLQSLQLQSTWFYFDLTLWSHHYCKHYTFSAILTTDLCLMVVQCHEQCNLNQIEMESDINSPKSKAFNIFLRFFQLALSLASTIFVTELVEKACITPSFRIIEMLVAASLLLSIIGLVTLKCSSAHPKVAFGVLFVLQVCAVGGVAGVALREMLWGEECAVSGVFNHYYLGAIALYALMVVMVLLLPLLWVQRYSNSPGNIIWVLFLLKVVAQWPTAFRWTIAALAAALLLQSLLTLVVNLLAGCKGVTTTVKSLVKCAWLFDLLLVVGTEAVTVVVYMNCREGGQFAGFDGTQTRVVLEAFMLINLVDLVFWLYGLQALDYENGDSVRDELVRFGLDPTFDEQSDVHDYDPKANFGEIA